MNIWKSLPKDIVSAGIVKIRKLPKNPTKLPPYFLNQKNETIGKINKATITKKLENTKRLAFSEYKKLKTWTIIAGKKGDVGLIVPKYGVWANVPDSDA